jgi:hypothetical protein
MTAALTSTNKGDEIEVYVGTGERKGTHLPLTTYNHANKSETEDHKTETGSHTEKSIGDMIKDKLYGADD